jgi:hypothetical protein
MFCFVLLLLVYLFLVQDVHLQLGDFILHASLPVLDLLDFIFMFVPPQQPLFAHFPYLLLQVVARGLDSSY